MDGLNPQPGMRLDVKLAGLADADKVRLLGELKGMNSSMAIRHMCLASTARTYLDTTKYPCYGTGQVAPVDHSAADLDILAENLRLHVGGAIIYHAKFSMLLFPAQHTAWKFLQPEGLLSNDTRLYFRILAPLPPPEVVDVSRSDPSENWQTAAVRFMVGIDLKRAFTGNQGKSVELAAFLVFDRADSDYVMMLTYCLQEMGAKVYHSSDAGSWDYFRVKHRAGVILVSLIFFIPDSC